MTTTPAAVHPNLCDCVPHPYRSSSGITALQPCRAGTSGIVLLHLLRMRSPVLGARLRAWAPCARPIPPLCFATAMSWPSRASAALLAERYTRRNSIARRVGLGAEAGGLTLHVHYTRRLFLRTARSRLLAAIATESLWRARNCLYLSMATDSGRSEDRVAHSV